MMVTLPLHAVAHSRAGDKGNRSNISLIAYQPAVYAHLLEQITEHRVHRLFAHKGASRVVRYRLDKLHALNFVIDNVLEGGVNDGLGLDGHGKTLSSLLLGLSIAVPDHLARHGEKLTDRVLNT